MFEHSVKVPRHYKIAANIFKKVSTKGGSVKALLYDDKLKHYRTNVLFALITETIKHSSDLNNIFESCNILQTESRLDPWLAKILTAELLYGKKALPGKSKPEQTVLSYKEQFEKYLAEHEDTKVEEVKQPRYVRINTNILTTSDAIGAFQDEGYRFIRCTSGSYDDYINQIKNLTEYDFTQDYHVKTIFVFAPGTKLHDHELYLENKIILQNKATAMAVHLLAPPAGSVVLDMCAAPGMKTTQVAAYLRNNGKVYAVERNEERYQTLCEFVKKTGSHCVTPMHKDCLEIKRGQCEDVDHIILDPSCSGSGMTISVHDYIEETRLAKLTSLQEKFLKHAMNAFPRAKKIVYSTCSMFPEENERVITNVVRTSRSKWRVLDVKEILKGQWNNYGSGMYGTIGTRCLYAKPETDLTTGFFVAVLERDPKELERNTEKKNKNKRGNEEVDHSDYEMSQEKTKKKKNKSHEPISTELVAEEDKEEVEVTASKKKRKKSSKNCEAVDDLAENLNELAVVNNNDEPVKKKKKKDKKQKIEESLVDIEGVNTIANDNSTSKKKKKKRKNNECSIEVDNAEVIESTEIEPSKKKKKKKKNRDKDVEMS